MLKTIAKILLLALLAYFFEDILNTILPLPTESMVDGLLDLSTDSGVFWLTVFRYIVWIIFLALFFKYVGPVFNFVVPVARRYTTTKLFRRFQGALSEVVTFVFFFVLFGTIISAPLALYKSQSLQSKAKKDTQAALDEMFEESSQASKDALKKNEERANIRILTIHKNYIFEHGDNAFTDYVFSQKPPWPSSENKLSYLTFDSALFKKLVKYHKKITENSDDYDDVLDPIETNPNYKKLLSKQIDLMEEQKDIDSMHLAWKTDNVFHDDFFNSIYDDDNKENKFSTVFIDKFLGLKWITFFMTVIMFIGAHYSNRQDIGKRFEKLIRFFEQGRFGQGGSARFAGLFEEWATLFKNQKQGLFMGRSLYNPFLYIGLEDDRHMLTVAGSRAGKGTSAIIPNLLLWEGSALVIDPKGTNAAVTADHRRLKMEQKVEVIDPFNISRIESGSFNPLELLDPKAPTIREDINVIAEALVVPDEKQKEKHWDDGARTVIAGLIAHLVTSPKYEHPTLPMIRDMISMMPEDQAELWADMSLNDGAGRLAKDAANRIIRGINTNEISSIISNADKHTEWLSSPAIKKVLSSSSFQFTDLKEIPTTLYLVLPPQYLQTHNRFLRLFVNLAINQMSKGGRSKVPVLLMMDEFLALGKMEEVEKAFGLMAGYNLVMWPFVQDMGRLKELYGKSVNAFIANSRAVQVFGVSDEETKEFVSNYIGDKSSGGGDTKNPNYRHIVKLRDPVEVAKDISAESNKQYILRSGKAPLILEKVKYYDSAPIKWLKKLKSFDEKRWGGPFEGLYDPDPDYTEK